MEEISCLRVHCFVQRGRHVGLNIFNVVESLRLISKCFQRPFIGVFVERKPHASLKEIHTYSATACRGVTEPNPSEMKQTADIIPQHVSGISTLKFHIPNQIRASNHLVIRKPLHIAKNASRSHGYQELLGDLPAERCQMWVLEQGFLPRALTVRNDATSMIICLSFDISRGGMLL